MEEGDTGELVLADIHEVMDDVDTVEEKEQLVRREMLGLVAKVRWEGVSLFGTEGSDQHQTEA